MSLSALDDERPEVVRVEQISTRASPVDRTQMAREERAMTARSGHRGFGHVRELPSGWFQASYVAPDLRRLNAPMTS